MPVRRRKPSADEALRAQIRSDRLITRLEDYVLGDVDLKPPQVSAALGLLRKTIPDLTAVDQSGEIDVRRACDMSDDELAAIAAGGGVGAAPTTDAAEEPDRVVPALRVSSRAAPRAPAAKARSRLAR